MSSLTSTSFNGSVPFTSLHGNTTVGNASMATGQHDPWMSETSRVLQILVTLVIFLVGTPLNALVVWVLGVRRFCSSSHHLSGETRGASSFRVYVVNLAVADLVLLLRTPLMLAYLAKGFSWPLGHAACRLVMFLRALGLYMASGLLCAVALERCLCLLRPVWASLKRPRWAVPLACGLLWVLAVGLAAPYAHTATLMKWNGKYQCLESNPKDKSGDGFFITETIFGFMLPVVIFLSCNLAVLISARRADGATSTMTSPTTANPTSPAPLLSLAAATGAVSNPANTNYASRRMLRLYRVLLLTMLLFLVCWVPYFTFRFLRWLAGKRADLKGISNVAVKGYYVSLFLVYVKSALNPVLYVFAAKGLGRTVRASLLSAVDRVFYDDNSESLRRKSLRRKDSQF